MCACARRTRTCSPRSSTAQSPTTWGVSEQLGGRPGPVAEELAVRAGPCGRGWFANPFCDATLKASAPGTVGGLEFLLRVAKKPS